MSEDAPSGPNRSSELFTLFTLVALFSFSLGAGTDRGMDGSGRAGMGIGGDDDAPVPLTDETGSGVAFNNERLGSVPLPCVDSAIDWSNFASSCPLLLSFPASFVSCIPFAFPSTSASRFDSFPVSVVPIAVSLFSCDSEVVLLPLPLPLSSSVAATEGRVDPPCSCDFWFSFECCSGASVEAFNGLIGSPDGPAGGSRGPPSVFPPCFS